MATKKEKKETARKLTSLSELKLASKPTKSTPTAKEKDADPAPAPIPPRIQRYRENLPCKLTDRELLDLGDRMAEVGQSYSEEESALDGIKSEYKARLTKLESEGALLATKIRAKNETREIQCERVYDYAARKIIERRLDTQEIVRTREMTDSEAQMELDLHDKAERQAEAEVRASITEEMIMQAVGMFRDTRRASLSALKRRMSINATVSTAIMEILQERGVVGPTKGEEPREILIDLDVPGAGSSPVKPVESSTEKPSGLPFRATGQLRRCEDADEDLIEQAAMKKPDNDFVASVRAWFEDHGEITEAQREALQDIIDE